MAEGLFTLSIRSRCELSGRGDKNRGREVRKTEGERRRRGQRESKTSRQKNIHLGGMRMWRCGGEQKGGNDV